LKNLHQAIVRQLRQLHDVTGRVGPLGDVCQSEGGPPTARFS
jgi:hypothetical protein